MRVNHHFVLFVLIYQSISIKYMYWGNTNTKSFAGIYSILTAESRSRDRELQEQSLLQCEYHYKDVKLFYWEATPRFPGGSADIKYSKQQPSCLAKPVILTLIHLKIKASLYFSLGESNKLKMVECVDMLGDLKKHKCCIHLVWILYLIYERTQRQGRVRVKWINSLYQ